MLTTRCNTAAVGITAKRKGFFRANAGSLKKSIKSGLRIRSKSSASIASNSSRASSVQSRKSYKRYVSNFVWGIGAFKA